MGRVGTWGGRWSEIRPYFAENDLCGPLGLFGHCIFETRSCVSFGQFSPLYLSGKRRGRYQIKNFPDYMLPSRTSSFSKGMLLCSRTLSTVERRARPWMPSGLQGLNWLGCQWPWFWLGAGGFRKILAARVMSGVFSLRSIYLIPRPFFCWGTISRFLL